MRVYVAVYDVNGNFLIGRKRERNRFWDGDMSPITSVVEGARLFCLPAGEKKPSETNMDAAKRIFLGLTGCPIPGHHLCTINDERDGYALVGFEASKVLAARKEINVGLVPFYRDVAPVNDHVVDWELGEVLTVQVSMLHRYLGVARETDDSKPGFYYPKNEATVRYLRRYKEIADALISHFG